MDKLNRYEALRKAIKDFNKTLEDDYLFATSARGKRVISKLNDILGGET